LPVKQYKNWNYCFTHGGNVNNNHTSMTCACPSENHQCAATRSNMHQHNGRQLELHEQDSLPKRLWQTSSTNPFPTPTPQLCAHLQLPNGHQQATIPYCARQLGFWTSRQSLPASQQHPPTRNPRMDGINHNCYYLHILGLLCSQIVNWYLSDGFLQYLRLHYPMYDCQSGFIANCVSFLWLPSKLFCNGPNLYLFLHMLIRFLEQLKSLKTNGERKNVWSIFLLLKPTSQDGIVELEK
jgi:hypothetical protein